MDNPDDTKRRVHSHGAIHRMLEQEVPACSGFKDRQAPLKKLPGFGSRDTEKMPSSESGTVDVVAEENEGHAHSTFSRETSTKPANDQFVVRMIAAEKIKPWKYANRPDSEFGDWDRFVKSVADEGVQVPIHVRPDSERSDEFEVVAGRRRWRACLELGIEVPCFINPYTDQEAAALQQLENDERTGLSEWADAMNFKRLIEDGVFKSQSALAVSLGVDRRVVSETMAYTRIDERLCELIGHFSNITRKHALVLSAIKSEQLDEAIELITPHAVAIRDGKLSASKLKTILSVRTDKMEPKTVKVNGVDTHTLRKDSNGTAVIALRKGLIEIVTPEEVSQAITELYKSKLSVRTDKS